MEIDIEPLGDQAAIIQFNGDVSPDLSQKIANVRLTIETAQIDGIVETVPAFASLAVYYEPWKISFESLKQNLMGLAVQSDNQTVLPKHFEIPTCYSEEFGLDLGDLANAHLLTIDEVVALHCAALYTVAMIGFTPGFPYLLGLPTILSTPRRANPRQSVPAGSVGIGESQTGIYSLTSPAGWNIIGRTPIRLFDIHRTPVSLLKASDTVRFVPIDERHFDELQEDCRQ